MRGRVPIPVTWQPPTLDRAALIGLVRMAVGLPVLFGLGPIASCLSPDRKHRLQLVGYPVVSVLSLWRGTPPGARRVRTGPFFMLPRLAAISAHRFRS